MAYLQISEKENVSEFYRLHNITVQYQTTNLDSAKYFMDSCIDISRKIESSYYLGKALQLKTRGEFYEGDIDSSIMYGNQSLSILKDYPDSLEYFLGEYNQGNIYLYKDDNIQALVQFKKAAKLIDQNFETYVEIDRDLVVLNRAYCHASIGFVLMNLEDYVGALKSFRKSLKVAYHLSSFESEMLRSIILSNMGSCYFSLGDYDLAESYAIASMEQKKKLGQDGSIGYSFQVLASAAFGRKKYDLSLRYLKESDDKFKILNNAHEIDKNKFLRAKNFLAMRDSEKAIELFKEVEPTYLQTFSKKEQAEFYEEFALAYMQINDLVTANAYLRITIKLRKELDVKNDKKIVDEFITFFEHEEVELNSQIENLKNVQEREKLELQIAGENEKKVWIYTLFLVSIICLILVILVIASAYRRNRKANKELNETIEEKQILFKEVHHRVKNNFQIISSLLNLQHGIEEDERGKKVLTDAQGRIQSMSLVHELLYRKNEVKRIDFKTYAEELVASIVKSFTQENTKLEFNIKAQNVSFDLEVAIPLGLILNEAVTNSVKYAFNETDQGKIDIELTKLGNLEYLLMISDDGLGIPDNFINGDKETLGIELISILSQQLGGRADISNNKGTQIQVIFRV